MSRKNTPSSKKIRRLERALRKGRLPARLDLIHWLMDHGHAQTRGAAAKLIMERRVKHESHVLGFRIIDRENPETKETEKHEIYDRFVPSSLRPNILVAARDDVTS